MTITKKEYYTVGSFSTALCPANPNSVGHPTQKGRIEWTGKSGKQKVGNLVCLCGESVRIIQYAKFAK